MPAGLRRLIPSLTGILLENTLGGGAAETMQTSWGSYGALKDLAHTAFDPPPKLQSVCVTCLLVNTPPLSPRRAAGGWGGGSVCLKKCLEMWASGPESSPGKSASINVPGICHINTRPRDVCARFPGGPIRAVYQEQKFFPR